MKEWIEIRRARFWVLPPILLAMALHFAGMQAYALFVMAVALLECAAFVDAYRTGWLKP